MDKVFKFSIMMFTTGRSPVMAAPTARPVKPASEIGVSSTRSLPNSSNKPERTLNGVPASATSSPMMQTFASRRISSASASRIACANVSSRSFCAGRCVSGIHVLCHFIDGRVRSRHCEVDCLFHLGLEFSLHLIKRRGIGEFLLDQPLPKIRDRIPLCLPKVFFLLGTVVFAIDVADVMSVVAIGVAEQERRTVAATGAIHQALRDVVDGAHVLTVHAGGFQAKRSRSHQDVSGCGFRVMRVFRVKIVLADVDHRKLEQLGEVHHFVQHSLTERAFSKKTYRYAAVTETPSRECRASCNPGAAAYDRVRSQVAGGRVCDVHGTAFALAVPGLLAQQFGEHLIRGSAFRQTMSMTAMRAGDVVSSLERFTYAHSNRLLTDVKMRQSGHQRPRVKLIDLRFELADGDHLPVHPEPQLDFFRSFSRLRSGRHF